MNYNEICYAIYLPVTFYITVMVGWKCFREGKVYLDIFFNQDHSMVNSINNLLLTGYYLLNLGYAALMLNHWKKVESIGQVIESVSEKVGFILLLLGGMHFFNLFITAYLGKRGKQNTLISNTIIKN